MAVRELYLEHDLNAYLAETQATESDSFIVDSESKADWALRKIREAEARIAQVQQFAQKRIDEINAWVDKITASEQRSIEYFSGLLEVYHRKLFESNPKLKTIKLPSGELQLRKTQPQYARDDAKLTAWLKERHPDLVKVKETPDWEKAKQRFVIAGRNLVDPNTGEIVDGVEVYEPEAPAFKVKTYGEGGN